MLACVRGAKDLRPFAEAEIGCDDDTGALIELAEKVEHQRTCDRVESFRKLPSQIVCGSQPDLFIAAAGSAAGVGAGQAA